MHSFTESFFLDLAYGSSSGYGLSHVLGDDHDLVDTDTAFISEVITELASVGLINGDILIHSLGRNVHDFLLGDGCESGLLTLAESSYETLCDNADNGVCDKIRLESHVLKSGNGRSRGVGMEGGNDKVTGDRCLNGYSRGFLVTDLSDHDYVRVLTEN